MQAWLDSGAQIMSPGPIHSLFSSLNLSFLDNPSDRSSIPPEIDSLAQCGHRFVPELISVVRRMYCSDWPYLGFMPIRGSRGWVSPTRTMWTYTEGELFLKGKSRWYYQNMKGNGKPGRQKREPIIGDKTEKLILFKILKNFFATRFRKFTSKTIGTWYFL